MGGKVEEARRRGSGGGGRGGGAQWSSAIRSNIAREAHGVVREDLAAAVGGPVSRWHANDAGVVIAVAVGGLGDEDAAIGGGETAGSEC